ncbi:MAG: hypothetical protein AAF846_04845 [Chloroflexota bacterium]
MSPSLPRRTEHIPPSDEQIEQVVHDASAQLAESKNDASYIQPEHTYGLTAFIKLMARIQAQHANESASHETSHHSSDFDSRTN